GLRVKMFRSVAALYTPHAAATIAVGDSRNRSQSHLKRRPSMNRRLNVVLVLLSLCVALNLAPPARAQAKVQAGDRLAICGDSITEQKLYCVYMEEDILMCKAGG